VTGVGRAVSAKEMQDMETEREVAQDARQQPEKTARVVVVGQFQVTHEGTDYQPGDHAEVPASVAERWRANGWVTDPKRRK
jgi:hypothetical protein